MLHDGSCSQRTRCVAAFLLFIPIFALPHFLLAHTTRSWPRKRSPLAIELQTKHLLHCFAQGSQGSVEEKKFRKLCSWFSFWSICYGSILYFYRSVQDIWLMGNTLFLTLFHFRFSALQSTIIVFHNCGFDFSQFCTNMHPCPSISSRRFIYYGPALHLSCFRCCCQAPKLFSTDIQSILDLCFVTFGTSHLYAVTTAPVRYKKLQRAYKKLIYFLPACI